MLIPQGMTIDDDFLTAGTKNPVSWLERWSGTSQSYLEWPEMLPLSNAGLIHTALR